MSTNARTATHPLVLALLHLTRQIAAARCRPNNPLAKWPTPAELLAMADAEIETDLTMRRRTGKEGQS